MPGPAPKILTTNQKVSFTLLTYHTPIHHMWEVPEFQDAWLALPPDNTPANQLEAFEDTNILVSSPSRPPTPTQSSPQPSSSSPAPTTNEMQASTEPAGELNQASRPRARATRSEVCAITDVDSGEIFGKWDQSVPAWPKFRYYHPENEDFRVKLDVDKATTRVSGKYMYVQVDEEDSVLAELVGLCERFGETAIANLTNTAVGAYEFKSIIVKADDIRQWVDDIPDGTYVRLSISAAVQALYETFLEEARYTSLPLTIKFSHAWMKYAGLPKQQGGVLVEVQKPYKEPMREINTPAAEPIRMTDLMRQRKPAKRQRTEASEEDSL